MKEVFYKKIIYELINLVDEGVYVVDKEGIGLFYNSTMASMEKVNVEDVLGLSLIHIYLGFFVH